MQFTEKFILSLKPKNVRYDIREGSGNGFAIRISPNNEKSWIFFYTFEGKKRRLTFGRYPALSLAGARKKHREAMKVLESGKDPAFEKQREQIEARDSSTVEGLIEEYLEKHAKPHKRSWAEDERILIRDVLPKWGKRKAKDITKREVIMLLEDIVQRNAPIAANRTLAVVRKMFNFGVERDILPASPCSGIKALAKENQRDRCLTTDEIKLFWHALERFDPNDDNVKMSPQTKLALKLQLVTAQRKGEIINAEWNEIDFVTGVWTIPKEKAKNNVPHRVPLSPLAIELLQEIKKLSGKSRWLFPAPKADKPMTGEAIARALLRSIKAIGAEQFTPHDIRRTSATHMTAMGISRLVVSKILNHADNNSVTSVYDRHSYDDEKRHALDAWSQKLKEIIDSSQSANNIIPFKDAI